MKISGYTVQSGRSSVRYNRVGDEPIEAVHKRAVSSALSYLRAYPDSEVVIYAVVQD